MKTYLAILLSFITLLHASAMAQEKVDNKIRLDSVKDVDNPFAKKLDGTKVTVIDPATIVRNLQALENKQEEEQTQQKALVNAAELTDLQAVINALKQPAQKVEYIAKEKLPLVSRPLSQYELRGVMVSFADDPSLLSQYDKFNIEDMVSSPEVVHVVQGFETLESIARLYDTSELAIEAANGLLPNESLLNGTPLIVPLSLPNAGTVTITEYYLQIAALAIESNNQVIVDKFIEQYADILQGDRFQVFDPEAAGSRYHKVMVGPYQSLDIAENKCFLIKASGGECLLREQQKGYIEQIKQEVKINPTYVAIVGIRGTNEDFLISEGERLGNGTAVVVSIFEDRLILQDGGIQSVMSMQEISAPVNNAPAPASAQAPTGPTVSCDVLLNDFSAAPEVQNLCQDDRARTVACDYLLVATRVGVQQCN